MERADGGASPQEQVDLASRLACVEKEIGAWSPDSRFIFMMKLEQVSTAGIKLDLERLYGVFLTTEAVDVRYFRLRSALLVP